MAQSEETQGSILRSGITLGGRPEGCFLQTQQALGVAFALEMLMTTQLCVAKERTGKEENNKYKMDL